MIWSAEHQNNFFVNKIAKLVATLPNLESVHEGKKHIKCFHCETNFSEEEDLKNHMKSIHEGKKYSLYTLCEENYATEEDLKNHIESVHERKKSFTFNFVSASAITKILRLLRPKNSEY